MLTALTGSELDGCYYRWLTGEAGVKEHTARRTVDDLANYHTGSVAGQ